MMDLAMESSSMCEKNKDWIGSEKLKKSLLKTLDKLSFDLEILALKHVDKTTDIGRKKLAQKLS